ncbi:MAG TPA: hypothetical protein VJ890_10910 [Vineibacter sp.]|nr:hypothetical protein [Vineibacter sp.]
MSGRRLVGWFGLGIALLPAAVAAQAPNPRAERLAPVAQWVGVIGSETAEGNVLRLWELPGLRQAANEALGAAMAREALRPNGIEQPVTREGEMLRWGWCLRQNCGVFGYVLVADPRRGDLFVCRYADGGRVGWMGTDPRMAIPVRGRPCDAANVTEFIRLNTRP